MTDKPKRPMSAYMMWLSSSRESIKSENPGLKVTEIAKKGGEIWRGMKDKSVWEEKAARAKEQYTNDLESFNAKGGREQIFAIRKKVKMTDKPKRPMSAYMMWLSSSRESIKFENPGLKVTEIAKKGGEIWRGLKDKSVWEEKAARAKEQYTNDLESFNANGGGEKKKVKMTDKPKRPMSAYMMWLSSSRESIKSENPGLKVTEIAKKGGEIWRGMKDKSVWEEKAARAKEQYTNDLESFNANGGGEKKKVKMTDKPKRPMSAYMMWLSSSRESIKSENPGLKVTEIAKKGGEIWRGMKDKSVWEEKAARAKEQYTNDFESFNANGEWWR